MRIYGPMLDLRLFDVHDAPLDSNWRPYNTEALELAKLLGSLQEVVGTPASIQWADFEPRSGSPVDIGSGSL